MKESEKYMKLKFGDIISVTFDEDTCWGPEGTHTAIILFDKDGKELQVHWLDKKMIKQRSKSIFNPAIDELDGLVCYWGEYIQVIGNLSYKQTRCDLD